MMQMKQVVQSGVLAAVLLIGCLPFGGSAQAIAVVQPAPVNLALDGDFEGTDSSPWLIEGEQASAVSIKSQDNHTSGGTHSAAYWSASAFHFKVSQRIVGLEDGRYLLSAYTQGGGGEVSSRIFATVEGDNPIQTDFINTGYAAWKNPQLTHINVVVTNGSCTIGFEVNGKADNWGSVDDITFTRIGDVETAPVSMTVQPVLATSWLHAAPELPSVVRAVYNDDLSYLQVPVQWETNPATNYDHLGVYQLTGAIQGSDSTVLATISVRMKPADLNADGIVNVGDLALAYYDMQASAGSADWERAKKADLNNDGKVDLADVQFIAEQMIQPAT
ncbi:Ig-like domain-containing protein [Paenibacillus sp. LjRoot56]|uniref:Ig-like domain-containing protein n=1 Tax=Paenibacillus sp. LjRoot56 TaxID=3342333 RepID=UPI003ECC9EF0